MSYEYASRACNLYNMAAGVAQDTLTTQMSDVPDTKLCVNFKLLNPHPEVNTFTLFVPTCNRMSSSNKIIYVMLIVNSNAVTEP